MLDRTQAPSFQRSTQLNLLHPQILPLSNGNTLYLIQGGMQPVMSLDIIIPAGKWYESAVGISQFTALQMDKGTRSKTSYQIASVFDFYGAHFSVNPGHDFITISLYIPTKDTHEVFATLLDILIEPVFEEKELTLSKAIAIQNLKINEEKTAYLAGKYFRKAIYGSHPYANEPEASHIENVQSNDLKNHYRTHAKNITTIAAGNINDALANQLCKLLGQLPIGDPPVQIMSVDYPLPHSRHFSKQGSVQTSIRYGKRTINRKHSDFIDLLFTTHILGGYFGSRLMKNIREEKGLTYGIYASVQSLIHDSFFVIGADVACENREIAIAEIKKEVHSLCEHPVGEKELATARNHFIGSLQAEVSTTFAHAEKFKTTALYKLPKDYYQTMINRVDAFTPKDVMQTAQRHFQTDSFTEISVG